MAQRWDHSADRMIPLCPSTLAAGEHNTCVFTFSAAANHSSFAGGVCAGTETKTSCFCGCLVSVHTWWFCVSLHMDGHLGPGRGRDNCQDDTLAPLLLTNSLFHQSIPLSHASISFPYSPEDHWAEDSSGSDVLVVHVGRRGGGGFHSDTAAMKRLDQWTVLCMPVCVWESMKFSSLAGGWDTEEPFMIYYLAPMAFTPKSEQPAELSSLHACVVTLQSIPGCEERGGKNTLVKAFPSAFPAHSIQTRQFWQATLSKRWGHI